MNTTIRTYLNPIIVTILMVVGMGLWAWQRWQSELQYYDDRIYRHANGVFDAVQGTVQALEQANSLERGQIEGILENVVRLSHLYFVALEQGGKRILEVGSAPATLRLTTGEGKSLIGRELLLWRRVQVQDETERDLNRNLTISGPQAGRGDKVMILGFEIPRESRMLSAAKKRIALTLVAALLFLATGLIVWIMVIRSRLIAGQLEAERARRDHLEELGLAAAGLAHETKNPLGIILGLAQQISANPEEPGQSRVMLEHIIDEVDKAQARLGNFMTFARQRKVNAIFLDVRAIVAKVAEILQPDFGALGVSLEIDCPPLVIFCR